MPERVAAVAGGAERSTEARVGPVGDHHVAGPDLAGLAGGLVLDHGAGHEAALDDGGDGLGALVGLGPGRAGVLEHDLVEVAPPHDEAVVGVDRVVGPVAARG